MYTRQIPSHLNLPVGSIMDKQQETAGQTFGAGIKWHSTDDCDN